MLLFWAFLGTSFNQHPRGLCVVLKFIINKHLKWSHWYQCFNNFVFSSQHFLQIITFLPAWKWHLEDISRIKIPKSNLRFVHIDPGVYSCIVWSDYHSSPLPHMVPNTDYTFRKTDTVTLFQLLRLLQNTICLIFSIIRQRRNLRHEFVS